jgi:hypothetical protein
MSRRLVLCLAALGLVPLLVANAAPASPAFLAPVGMAASGTEPGVDIGDDGTIFVNATTGLGVHSVLNRSTDGGATFQQVTFSSPWHRLPGGGDTDTAVAPGGRVYFLDLWGGSNSIAFSPDNGQTWTRGTPCTTLPLTDRQWLAVGPRDPITGNDTLYVGYQLIQPPSTVWISRSSDGGMIWDHHVQISNVDAFPGNIVADGDFVAMQWYAQGARTVHVATSTNRGATFTSEVVRANADGAIWSQAGFAMDGQNLYSVSLDRNTREVEVARSTDRGLTWEGTQVVSDPTHGTQFPWVAARNGKVAIAWYGSDNYVGNTNNAPASAEWVIKYVESTDGGATYTPETTATPPGDLVKRGAICTSGLGCNGGRELGDFLQIAIDAAGKSIISYVDVAGSARAKIVKQA